MSARFVPIVVGYACTSLLLGVACARPAAADYSDKPLRGDTTSYDFEDDLVQGDNVQPDVEVLHARRRGERSSLIRVRSHFMPELFKTAEDL